MPERASLIRANHCDEAGNGPHPPLRGTLSRTRERGYAEAPYGYQKPLT